MAIRVGGQLVISDQLNITNIGNITVSGNVTGVQDLTVANRIGIGATPSYGSSQQVISSNGTSSSWAHQRLRIYEYADRNQVRSLSPVAGDQVFIRDLGLFNWISGSTEIDDDETCFATASGRWLFEVTSTDYEFALSQAENLYRDAISLTQLNTIVSVGANTTATQNVTVTGLNVNDLVMLDSNFDISFRASATARVINSTTIRITVKNHTGTAITISDFAENGDLAQWSLLIFRGEA
jgi:hypothetical protein